MADTLLILTLPSFRSHWLFPMSMLSFSPNCWSRAWASHDFMRPFTLSLLMNAPKASCMTCALHGMWFLNGGHSIPEDSRVDCSSQVIEKFEEALWVVIPSKWQSVSSKWSRSSLKCTASAAPVCWPLTYHPWLAFQKCKRICDQPHRKRVRLLAILNFDPYSKQWLTLWLICSLMSTCPKLS